MNTELVESVEALLTEWDEAATPFHSTLHNGGGFALENWQLIRADLRALKAALDDRNARIAAVGGWRIQFRDQLTAPAWEKLGDLLSDLVAAHRAPDVAVPDATDIAEHMDVCTGCDDHEPIAWCEYCQANTIPVRGDCHNCNQPIARTTAPDRIQEH